LNITIIIYHRILMNYNIPSKIIFDCNCEQIGFTSRTCTSYTNYICIKIYTNYRKKYSLIICTQNTKHTKYNPFFYFRFLNIFLYFMQSCSLCGRIYIIMMMFPSYVNTLLNGELFYWILYKDNL